MNREWLYYSAAATTAIAGVLHLMMAPNMLNFNTNGGVFFFAAGAAQVFWAVPLIRKWGKPWHLVGIGGTIVLIAIWVITRMPGNPIAGRGMPINEMGIAVEAMQWAFVGLTTAILMIGLRMKRIDKRTALDTV